MAQPSTPGPGSPPAGSGSAGSEPPAAGRRAAGQPGVEQPGVGQTGPEQSEVEQPGPEQPEQQVRRSVAAAIIAVAVVLGLVVIGFAIRLGQDRLPSGPPLPPPAPTPIGVRLDAATRRAAYENVSLTLAGLPYSCAAQPEAWGPFASAAHCRLIVHESGAGTNPWTADTGLALVPDSLAVSGDPRATARAIFAEVAGTGYPKDSTVSKLAVSSQPDFGEAALLSARINIAVANLPTRYDSAFVLVLTAEDGRHLVFFSFKPNDAPEAALMALQTSLRTLSTSG